MYQLQSLENLDCHLKKKRKKGRVLGKGGRGGDWRKKEQEKNVKEKETTLNGDLSQNEDERKEKCVNVVAGRIRFASAGSAAGFQITGKKKSVVEMGGGGGGGEEREKGGGGEQNKQAKKTHTRYICQPARRSSSIFSPSSFPRRQLFNKALES